MPRGKWVRTPEIRKKIGDTQRKTNAAHPEIAKIRGDLIRQHYVKFPEDRIKKSLERKQYFIDHPEFTECIPGRPRKDVTVETILILKDQGLTNAEIVEKTGVSECTICRRLKEYRNRKPGLLS